MKKNIRALANVLTSVLLLFACVAATTIALVHRINAFSLNDSGAIAINPPAISADAEETTQKAPEESQKEEPPVTTDAPVTTDTPDRTDLIPETEATETKKPQQVQNPKPGFEVDDDNKAWTTNTEIEIFKISYENGEAQITVNSSDGDKVIAPGTNNDYIFKLKNTGNVALDYTVDVDAYVTPGDIKIPVTARLNRYDGQWIIGGAKSYVDVSMLDTAHDSAVLGAGKYTYYTLEWRWPFESGNDEYDTLLGNLAAEGEDITLTIVIKTTAEADFTETGSPGITSPETGDISPETMWFILGGSSAVLFVISVVSQISDKRRERSEAISVEE